MGRTDCICGSGRKFEVCCKPYINKTIEDYEEERKNNNKINSYYIAVGMLTNYLLKVEAHTNKLLESHPNMGKLLLNIDIKAFSELMNRVTHILYEVHITDDWNRRLESIKKIIDEPKWREKCEFYQIIVLSRDESNNNRQKLNYLLESIEPYEEMDIDLLMLLYEHYPFNGGLTKALQILDWIIKGTDDTFLKLKYKFSKAIRLYLSLDNEEAKNEAKEVILELETKEFDVDEPYINEQIACMYELYYHFEKNICWLQKSIKIRKNINLEIYNNEGKTLWYRNIGYTYWRMGKFAEAKRYFEDSIGFENNSFAQIYLLDCMVELNEITDLKDYLETVSFQELEVDTYDFLYVIGNAAIRLNDTRSIKIIKSYLKSINLTGNPYIDLCLKDLMTGIEEKSGTLRMILSKLKTINKYILFQPNINGIGLNVNNMLDDLSSDSDEEKL